MRRSVPTLLPLLFAAGLAPAPALAQSVVAAPYGEARTASRDAPGSTQLRSSIRDPVGSNRLGGWWLMSTSRGQQYPASPRPACQGPAATLHPGCPPVLPIRTASLASSAGIAGTGEDSVAGWDAGIRAPNYAQRACPQGTVAEPAIANPNAIRCVAR